MLGLWKQILSPGRRRAGAFASREMVVEPIKRRSSSLRLGSALMQKSLRLLCRRYPFIILAESPGADSVILELGFFMLQLHWVPYLRQLAVPFS